MEDRFYKNINYFDVFFFFFKYKNVRIYTHINREIILIKNIYNCYK